MFCRVTLSNALLFIDLVLTSDAVDLYFARLGTAAVSMLLLVFGLVWESE